MLDDAHLWATVRYVVRNPVRAGRVARAEDFPWSSAPAHCGLRLDRLLSTEFPPPGAIPDWAQWLQNEEDLDAVNHIRTRTHTGRPCGNPSFIDRLE